MLEIILFIIEQTCLNFPLIMGAYLSIALMNLPDLSIQTAYIFGAIIGSKILINFNNLNIINLSILIILTSLIAGSIVGFISSGLNQFFKIPFLLSTIITSGIFHGINQFFLPTANLSLADQKNILQSLIFLPKNPELATLIIYFFILLILGYLFLKTELGYSLAAYGNNPNFFKHYKISTKYIFVSGIMVSNALAGLSGFLIAQSSNFIDINMDFGISLFCIISLILGKTIYKNKKESSIIIPIIGLLSYFSIQQILLISGFDLKYFTMIQSIVIALILAKKFQKTKLDNNKLGI